MESKEDLVVRTIKRFYGISGVLDEYKRSQVNRIGNNAFILMFWYMLLANFVAVLFANKYPEETLWTYIGLNLFFTVFLVGGYVMIATSRLKLAEDEVEPEDVPQLKKKNIVKGFRVGITFAILIHFMNALVATLADGENFVTVITAPHKIMGSIVSGIIFGGLLYLGLRARAKQLDEAKNKNE